MSKTSAFPYNLGHGRKLTLDDFQMEHRTRDIPSRQETVRREKSALIERIKSARQESGSLREYSRRRFQSVVDLETHASRKEPPTSRGLPPPPLRPVTVSGYTSQFSCSAPAPLTPTNGPTRDGSILYNGAARLSCRPRSEPQSRFDHLRGAHSHYPLIQRTLEQSNLDYRLVSTPCQSARDGARTVSPGGPDFVMFIPVSSPDLESDVFEADDARVRASTPRDAWTTEAFPLSRAGPREHTDLSLGPLEQRLGLGEEEEEAEESAVLHPSTPQLQPPTPPTPPTPTDARHTLSQLSVPSKLQGGSSTRTQQGSRSRPASALSVSSSLSAVSITPRPRCWVDDLTVSSDESLADRDQEVSQDLEGRERSVSRQEEQQQRAGDPLAPNPSITPPALKRVGSPTQRGREPSQTLTKKVAEGKAARPSYPRSLRHSSAGGSGSRKGEKAGSVAMAQQQQQQQQQREEDEESRLLRSLPRFLCPSSESKSKQAATKEWLRKNSFTAACRTVPIM